VIRARRRFGQNFLEPAWVEKVIRAIDPRPDDTFIEIGPGRGALTRPLAARVKQVVAYEIDRDLAAELEASAPPNVTMVRGDFLTSNPQSLIPNPCRVAGNLPYNVASPVLFKLKDLFAAGMPIADAAVMLQREVADRLLARPGTKEYGVLTVLIRHGAGVERLLALPPGAFRPVPRVQSSLLRLRFHPPEPPVRDPAVFESLVQAVFTRRRKTLGNALAAYKGTVPARGTGTTERGLSPILAGAGIDGNRRPETLSIAEFARLADVLATHPR